MYTRVEQTSEYIVDNESQVSHIREKSYKSGKGKAKLKPLVLDWKHQYVLMFRKKKIEKPDLGFQISVKGIRTLWRRG